MNSSTQKEVETAESSHEHAFVGTRRLSLLLDLRKRSSDELAYVGMPSESCGKKIFRVLDICSESCAKNKAESFEKNYGLESVDVVTEKRLVKEFDGASTTSMSPVRSQDLRGLDF